MAMDWNNSMAELLSALKGADSIALISHVSPDGDTLGSALALKLALEKWNKNVAVFCQHVVPQMLRFMTGAEAIAAPDQEQAFDLAVAIDVADLKRMGDCQTLFDKAKTTAQIDHHGTNPGYAQINLVDGEACATAELIYEVIRRMDVEMDRETAICLYTAISTDTGNFSYDNTTPRAFEIMSRLLSCDLPLNELTRILFRLRSREQSKLLGRALDQMAFHAAGRISTIGLTVKDFELCGALPEHAEGIVNFGMDVNGVQMALFLRETASGDIKGSLRALPPSNVARVAARFGGGGHALAAGCTLHNVSLQEAERQLLAAMEEEL